MRNEVTTRVTLNGKAVPVEPALADCAGVRGDPALTLTLTVQLDVDDIAAAILSYLNTGGRLDDLLCDEDAWAVVGDMLINDGIGPALCGVRDEMTTTDPDNPINAFCRDRVVRLLATSRTAAIPGQRRSRTRELAGVSR